jgi:prepilin-type N-terminal cleavage/methylation domain-containing protein
LARPISDRAAAQKRLVARDAGFTIIELLTVLALIGLVSIVLLTGFERVLDIRLRLTTFLDESEAPVLVADWFRATIAGLVADPAEGGERFVGRSRQLIGLSLAPLNGTAGVPTRIAWEIVFNDQTGRSSLRYRNGADPDMVIASWPGDIGGLRYCDSDLRCGDTWPADPRVARLPFLVELRVVKGSEPWPILAAPANDRVAPLASADQL